MPSACAGKAWNWGYDVIKMMLLCVMSFVSGNGVLSQVPTAEGEMSGVNVQPRQSLPPDW